MKIFRLLTLFAVTVFALLLAGCAANAPVPTATAAIPAETATPFPTATEVVELPSATSQPTDIPATSTPTPDATQQAQAALLPLVAPCNMTNPGISYSPNQDWVVATCLGENQDGLITKFARTDGSKQWSISFIDTYIQPYRADDANMGKLLQESLIPVHWTVREDYVYLAVPAAEEKTPYKGYDALFRLDLASGRVTQTLDAATAPFKVSYAFKFSPGTKLAHINQNIQTVEIVIDDTVTGDAQTIKLDARFTQAGSLLWPQDDEKRLILSAFDANTTGGGYALIVYNFETNKNEYILQRSDNAYLPIDWLDEDTIYAKVYPTGEWVYINLLTKAISEAPAPATAAP